MADPTSQKPYLLRALYEWCVDNGYTPYVSVIVDRDTRVPVEFVRNGEIVLNIGPLAANRLKMGNEFIEFAARFGGVAKELFIPVQSVAAIYARETGHGMSFDIERAKPEPPQTESPSGAHTAEIQPKPPPSEGPTGGGRPTLRRIK